MLFLLLLISATFAAKYSDRIVCLRANNREVGTTFNIPYDGWDQTVKYYPFVCDNPCPCVCESTPEIDYTLKGSISNNKGSITISHTEDREMVFYVYWKPRDPTQYILKNHGVVQYTYPGTYVGSDIIVIAEGYCRNETEKHVLLVEK